MVEAVAENINFSAEEDRILRLWKEWDVFLTCQKRSEGKPRYAFYDGPPFATGLPHYGHILTGTIKDIVTRYAYQTGFHVERRFGWDCHGLPVEYEIDKALNIKGPEDVHRMGIDKYNQECRKIVTRYADEWEKIITRMARWIDFKNDYKTMYPSFMESVWWVFKTLFDSGLVYKGYKVMPYSTACNTPISNFESGQNYKEVVDPAVIVTFPLDDSPKVSMLAWTTTPWTLPSNLALVVNPDKDYVRVKDNSNENVYIMMEARLEALFKTPDEYTILEKFKGITLKDKTYEPLFPFFSELKRSVGAFRILCDGYVTEESGTGVVHSAPAFGEDDYRVSLAAGIISRDQEIACPVDACGRFIDPVTDFKGSYVKDADKDIIKALKASGRLVHQGTIKHSYPFCWRSETPLIYKAVPSWFIRVESMVSQLIENNQKTYWVPEFVKEKRFANWLKDARDWAISRNRYWGTPIPLWISDDGQEIVCVGSIKQLEELSGAKINDLHREFVDQLTIPSRTGKGVLRRVPEVFDCWFESGSMPYAQVHYPFENKKAFEDAFPADFIAEGIDQTRGWFYTLLVLSTALFGKPPFKNLISNGLILASDGQKMSKRKKNYPDPMEVIGKYGADALRLYLINSPAVRAENLRFREEGVRDILKDVFLPWYNAYRFLVQNVERLEKEDGIKFIYNESTVKLSDNIMDRWIISFTQSLIQLVKEEMAAYRLYTVVPRLVKFVDNLTNWYVRVNRKRLKGEGGGADCLCALETLFGVLYTMIRMMASFTPYLTELMYQNLKHLVHNPDNSKLDGNSSVHYLMFPQARSYLINKNIERAVQRTQSIIELGRIIRDRKTLPIKYPLPEVVVIQKDEASLEEVRSMEKYILEELNVRVLTTTSDKQKYGVSLRAEADHRTLGARLKAAFKPVAQTIKELSDAELQEFVRTRSMEILGHTITDEDVRIMYSFGGERAKDLVETYEADATGDILVLVNIKPDQSMQDEGIAREVINRIQKLRKKGKLVPLDEVTTYYSVAPAQDSLARIIQAHAAYIENVIKTPLRPLPHPPSAHVVIDERQMLKGVELALVITRGSADRKTTTAASVDPPALDSAAMRPASTLRRDPPCPYLNVQLCGTFAAEKGPRGTRATVLLRNPLWGVKLNLTQVIKEIQTVFGLQGREVKLYETPIKTRELVQEDLCDMMYGSTVYAFRRQDPDGVEVDKNLTPIPAPGTEPFCRYVNVNFQNIDFKNTTTFLLENPQGTTVMDIRRLEKLVIALFKEDERRGLVFFEPEDLCRLTKHENSSENLLTFSGKTFYAGPD